MNQAIFDLEPGNGTRYALLIIDDRDEVLVCWLSRSRVGGSCIRLLKGGECPDLRYVAEKMGVDIADAAAICAFVRGAFAVDIRIPSDFDQETGLHIESPSEHLH